MYLKLSNYLSYHTYQNSNEELVAESLYNGDHRQAWWSESIAVGGASFVETIQQRLGSRAKRRKAKETGEGFQLREDAGMYIADYDFKNCNIERYSTFSAGNNVVDTAINIQ